MGVPQNFHKRIQCSVPHPWRLHAKGWNQYRSTGPVAAAFPYRSTPTNKTISCFLFVIPHPERSRRRRNLLLSLLLQLPLSLPFCLSFRSEAPFPIRLTPTNIRHFDRSCSQHYREQRSGEIRFSLPPDIPTKSSLPLLLGKGGSQDPNRSALSRVEGPE